MFRDALYSVDLADGSQSLIGGLNLGDVAQEVGSDFDASNQLWMIVSGGRTYTVNTTTGEATFVANIVDVTGAPLFGFEGLAINSVPEPTTIVALAMCLTALALRRRSEARF